MIKFLSDIRSDCSCWFIKMKHSRVYKFVSNHYMEHNTEKMVLTMHLHSDFSSFNYSSNARQFFFFRLQILMNVSCCIYGHVRCSSGHTHFPGGIEWKEPRWHIYFVKAISINSADSLMIQCTHQKWERLLICCRLMFMWYCKIIYSAGLQSLHELLCPVLFLL